MRGENYFAAEILTVKEQRIRYIRGNEAVIRGENYFAAEILPVRGAKKQTTSGDERRELFCRRDFNCEGAENQIYKRPGSSDRSGNLGMLSERIGPSTPRKSQDAAVGALVQILKKAPPLRQDLSRSQQKVCKDRAVVVEVGSSSMGGSRVKTTSDALEELRAYMDMKQLLLRQSGGKS